MWQDILEALLATSNRYTGASSVIDNLLSLSQRLGQWRSPLGCFVVQERKDERALLRAFEGSSGILRSTRSNRIWFKRSLRLLDGIRTFIYKFGTNSYQATMKTRYCGHLYSPLLAKWTPMTLGAPTAIYSEVGGVRDLGNTYSTKTSYTRSKVLVNLRPRITIQGKHHTTWSELLILP